MTSTSNRTGLDRRTFITGVAATGLLVACGGSDPEPVLEADSFLLVQRFPAGVSTPGEIRLPFSIVDSRAEFINDGPAELRARVTDLDGNLLGEPLVASRRDVSPSSYYAFRTVIDTPGFYALIVEGGPIDGANFQVIDPSEVTIPVPGDPLPGFDTPTPGDPGGIDPICTRDPACDFHATTLSDALSSGPAVAYFVGTPAFCATGSCTPALEALVEVAPDFANDFVVVHAEVYADTTARSLAPAIEALGITFEPALFITDADGVIVERLDGLWNTTELRERLAVHSA